MTDWAVCVHREMFAAVSRAGGRFPGATARACSQLSVSQCLYLVERVPFSEEIYEDGLFDDAGRLAVVRPMGVMSRRCGRPWNMAEMRVHTLSKYIIWPRRGRLCSISEAT